MSNSTTFPNNSGYAIGNLQKKGHQLPVKHKQSHSQYQYANILNQPTSNTAVTVVPRTFKKKKNNVLSFDLNEEDKAAVLQNSSGQQQVSGINNILLVNLQKSDAASKHEGAGGNP